MLGKLLAYFFPIWVRFDVCLSWSEEPWKTLPFAPGPKFDARSDVYASARCFCERKGRVGDARFVEKALSVVRARQCWQATPSAGDLVFLTGNGHFTVLPCRKIYSVCQLWNRVDASSSSRIILKITACRFRHLGIAIRPVAMAAVLCCGSGWRRWARVPGGSPNDRRWPEELLDSTWAAFRRYSERSPLPS